MRDFARIDRIVAKLAVAWKRYPDTRLGQLIFNLLRDRDQFNTEDTTMERLIGDFIAEHPEDYRK